jgi:phosphoribosylformylglycinamidine cyclo-ligase
MTYADAGVDLSSYGRLFGSIKRQLRRSSEASGEGLFAGMIRLKGGRGSPEMLVASCDGVGTKVRMATLYGRHRGIGKDIVAHCVNDILCMGARPVAFLDYIAFARLDPDVFRQVVGGIARECRRLGIQLIGGETAEMPGVYREGEYDLVGFIVGLAAGRQVLDGSRIRKGDYVVGLPSNGLHTNGYSLAGRVLVDRRGMDLRKPPPGWREPLGRALLRPHVNYYPEVYPLIERRLLSGVAHVTGGGIAGNLGRILPRGTGAKLARSTWKVPRIFDLIAHSGPVEEDEMFRVFNMGLGLLLVTPHANLPEVLKVRSSRVVGEITEGNGRVTIA